MIVFEYQLNLKFLKSIRYEEVSEIIGNMIDSTLAKDSGFLEFHESRKYKNYVFDLPYPFEKGGAYEQGKVYKLRIRTVNAGLAEYFSEKIGFIKNNELQTLGGSLKIIQKKPIEKVFTLTAVLLKTESGYWKKNLPLEEFERRIKENLIKKYNTLTGEKINEDFQLYTRLRFLNEKPVKVSYKGILLLGDKVELMADTSQQAQELLYMALGTGIGENNARGAGFLGYRYL